MLPQKLVTCARRRALCFPPAAAILLLPAIAHAEPPPPAPPGEQRGNNSIEALASHAWAGIAGPNHGAGPPPTDGGGWGGTIGYRYREARWWEMSVGATFHAYAHTWQWSVPLLAHLRLPLPGGHGITFGLGLGLQNFRGTIRPDPELRSSYFGPFAQAALGANIQLDPRWALVLAATITAGLGGSTLTGSPTGEPDHSGQTSLMLGANGATGIRHTL